RPEGARGREGRRETPSLIHDPRPARRASIPAGPPGIRHRHSPRDVRRRPAVRSCGRPRAWGDGKCDTGPRPPRLEEAVGKHQTLLPKPVGPSAVNMFARPLQAEPSVGWLRPSRWVAALLCSSHLQVMGAGLPPLWASPFGADPRTCSEAIWVGPG